MAPVVTNRTQGPASGLGPSVQRVGMITTIIHAAKITIVVIFGYNNKNSKNSSTTKINGG